MESKLAENIRSYRKGLGLSQEQLAERLGITLGTVSKWERGSSEPDLGYIMDLAELFHVSVDALIGFSMHGTDADGEAARIEALEGTVPPETLAAEYDSALMKFPNHFRIVMCAAFCHCMIGTVYKREEELKRALELFRHAIELISQNRDPKISEVLLRDQIAGIYASMKDYRKSLEEYKKNNICGNNDDVIGLQLIQHEQNLKEGIEYTGQAFIRQISTSVTVTNAFFCYYCRTGNPERGIRAAEWSIAYLTSLKEDPEKRCYLDKIISLYYMALASLQHRTGQAEQSAGNLRKAIGLARAFDADPVFTLENILFTEQMERTSFYDTTGPTALEGMKAAVDEGVEDGYVTEAFREEFKKVIGQ